MINRKISGNISWITGNTISFLTSSIIMTIDSFIISLSNNAPSDVVTKKILDRVFSEMPSIKTLSVSLTKNEITVYDWDGEEYSTSYIHITNTELGISEDELFALFLTFLTHKQQHTNILLLTYIEKARAFLWNIWRPKSAIYLVDDNSIERIKSVRNDSEDLNRCIGRIIDYHRKTGPSKMIRLRAHHGYICLSETSVAPRVKSVYIKEINDVDLYILKHYLEKS